MGVFFIVELNHKEFLNSSSCQIPQRSRDCRDLKITKIRRTLVSTSKLRDFLVLSHYQLSEILGLLGTS